MKHSVFGGANRLAHDLRLVRRMPRDRWSRFSLTVLLLVACQTRVTSERSQLSVRSASSTVASAAVAPDFIRVEALEGEAPPMFVMRGAPRGAARLVFLHGMCGHGLGYAQAFARSAAKHGTLIAPQGNISCGGGLSKWSYDVAALDARITKTFRLLADPDPEGELTIIGMSQGATLAARLVQRWPARYTRLISIAAPSALEPGELRSLHSAVMMAGERDRQDLMRESARALTTTRVPATFMLIPKAAHGDLGSTPEQTMGQALSWVFAH